MEVKSDGVDEEMKDDVDSVRGLLDRLKQEKESELQKFGSSSVQESGISISDSKGDDVINELQKRQASLVMNLKSVVRTKEPSTKFSQEDGTTQNDTGDNSKKRKQDSFLVEVQERAEVISKSARKGPESLVSSIAQTAEEDPDTEDFLKKIRAAPSTSSEVQIEDTKTRPYRSKSASEVDLSVVVSSSSQLNLEPQKSKIPLGRSGSLKGRRKPTVSMRRRSLKSSFTGDWDDPDAISEGEESMDEEESDIGLSGGSFIIKDPPQIGAGGEVRPRSRPKPKVKSQTVAGIALPGLAEVLNKKNISTGDVRPQASAAEIVRAAAEGKKNQAAKEERVEKEPEKPAWLVEAEARRKLHERRRHPKAKQHEEMDQDQDKPLNGVVLRPVAQRSEPVVDNSDISGVALRSVAHRNEPVVGKSDSPGGNKLHNVMLRPVRKPEPVSTKSEDDNDKSRAALNICLRPVSKPEPVAKQSDERESESSRPHNVFLRPLPKPEPVVNSNNAEDSHGRFQHVRLKPIVYPMGPKSSGSKVTDTELTPITNRTSSDVRTQTEPGPLKIRTSSEVTTSSSPPVKAVTQSLSHPGTSLRVYENGETSSGLAGTTKTSPEYQTVHSLTPITSEKPTTTRSEPKVISGSRVTVSSNYVSAPHKVAPKTKPKPSNRSKTVTVTASEVPDPSSVRRKSVEVIHAKVEWKGSRTSSSAVSHNTKSFGDLRALRKGSDYRDRSDAFDTAYRPTYTGDVLPQWKIDLMEKKKNVAALPDRPQPTKISNSVAVPLWKKELAEKRKQRVDVNSVQALNKENELKTSPEIPPWKKELAERKTRRTQPIVIPKGPSEDSAEQVPSFMREFEKKKRTFPRGGNNASYV